MKKLHPDNSSIPTPQALMPITTGDRRCTVCKNEIGEGIAVCSKCLDFKKINQSRMEKILNAYKMGYLAPINQGSWENVPLQNTDVKRIQNLYEIVTLWETFFKERQESLAKTRRDRLN